jgi:hypothetical protein
VTSTVLERSAGVEHEMQDDHDNPRIHVTLCGATGRSQSTILPYWHALLHVAQLYGWMPDHADRSGPTTGTSGRTTRAIALGRLRARRSFAPGGRDTLSAAEAGALADAIELALPDAGSHNQFLELEHDEDIFFTRASPLQWLGLDRQMLVADLLPLLRSGSITLVYHD